MPKKKAAAVKPTRQKSRMRLYEILLDNISTQLKLLQNQLENFGWSDETAVRVYAAHTYNWLVYYCKSINTYYGDVIESLGIEKKDFELDTIMPQDVDYDDLCEKFSYILSYRNHYSAPRKAPST